MSELVANCPRCRAKKITFDLISQNRLPNSGWQRRCEAFCICRACSKGTVFVLMQNDSGAEELLKQAWLPDLDYCVNDVMHVDSYIAIKDMAAAKPPEHLPEELKGAYREAATCVAVKCPNGAGTMFRLCVDLATRPLLPQEETSGLNRKTRRDLGLRLPWLFDNGVLPRDLRGLSSCIREDGNDGAHAGTLTMEDAEDLMDFAFALLERLHTEPAKLQLAMERRAERRQMKQ